MLRVRGVDKAFAVRHGTVQALREVDLDVRTGSFTAILGPSGSGKTTLLRVVAGFERPDAGELTLDGRVLAGAGRFVRPERRGIGVVPQDGALFPHLDVAGNVAFGLGSAAAARFAPARQQARRQRVAELLELVGLAGYERRRMDELSGGQQQRVALARALAPSPSMVLLDEPFSALDAGLRAELGVEVRELLRGLTVTTLLVTHDRQEALSLAGEVAVMRDGRVVQVGPPEDVYGRPVDAQTAGSVGDAVLLPGRVLAGGDGTVRAECELGAVTGTSVAPLRPGERCQVLVRPHRLAFAPSGAPARVVASEYLGHERVVRLRLGAGGDGPEVRVRTDDAAPQPGSVTHVMIDGEVFILAD